MVGHGLFNFNIRVSPSIGMLAGNLSRFAGDIRSVREPMKQAVDEVVKDRIADNFAWETDSGIKWPDMAPVTPYMPYRRNSPGQWKPLLDVTGNLLKAALADARWTFDGQTGEAWVPYDTFMGSNAPYGFYQHEGTYTTGLGFPHVVPPRPFFSINNAEDLPRMEEIFSEWLGRRVEGAIDAGRGTTLYGRR